MCVCVCVCVCLPEYPAVPVAAFSGAISDTDKAALQSAMNDNTRLGNLPLCSYALSVAMTMTLTRCRI